MREHPRHAEIVEAIKAWKGYQSPRTLFESEISECFSESELVAWFGWEGEKALTPKQAVKAVRLRCAFRQEVFGWQLAESELEAGR